MVCHHNMSEQQKQLYIDQSLIGYNNLYTLSFTITFEGELNHQCLCKSIQKIFNYNKILKCRIINYNGSLRLATYDNDVKIEYIGDVDQEIGDYTEVESFDLMSDVLYKVKLMKVSNYIHILYFSFHHILLDGSSIKLLCESLRRIYNEELCGMSQIDSKVQLQRNNELSYFDYIFYQDIFMKSIYYRQQKEYYRAQLKEPYDFLNFPEKNTEIHHTYDSVTISNRFDFNTFLEMQKYALTNKIQINSIFLAGLIMLLGSYCNTDDIIVGCIASGRENNILFRNIIGFFSNIMTLRLRLNPEIVLKDFLLYVNGKMLEGIINQDYSYGEIVHDVSSYGNGSSKSLIQVIFNMQKSYDLKNQWDGIKKVNFHLNKINKTIYDLIVDIKYDSNEINIEIEYADEVFSRLLIERFSQNFQYILQNILLNMNMPLSKISCICPYEQELILKSYNNTKVNVNFESIFDIVNKSIKNNMNNLAVSDQHMQLKYGEIKKYINSFASFLAKDKTENEVIAILLDRSSYYVISLLSILSTNAAFVPIDPNIPQAMQIKILNNCAVKRIVTARPYESIAESLKNKREEMSVIYVEDIDVYEADYKMPKIEQHNLAYIMFTSGTTGDPKGAMISHCNLINLFFLFKRFFNICNENKLIQFSSISFDASVWEIFMALYHGAALYIPDKTVILDTNEFYKYIDTYQIDTMTLPPVYARQLKSSEIHSIKNLIVAGSISYTEDYTQWKDKLYLYNAYGLTETTICATVYDANDEVCNIYRNELPVGKPAPNCQLFVLDKWKRIAPLGVVGELYISGRCLSSGYINNDLLTKEVFVSNNYIGGKTMYKTGDLALWLEDGNIVIIGRNDDQIKVKGIRIELSAIESIYLKYKKIKQFAVVASKSNTDYIIKAFYQSDDKLDENELRRYGEGKLPKYMVPHVFVKLENVPVNLNGKVDKKFLAGVDTTRKQSGRIIVDHSNGEQIIMDKVQAIISELINNDADYDSNFLEMGLDSYLLMQLRNKVQTVFNVDIRIVELFKYTSIYSLSKYLGKLLEANV